MQILFAQPTVELKNRVDNGIAKRQTASTHLKQLVDISAVEKVIAGRERLYLNTRLLQELND